MALTRRLGGIYMTFTEAIVARYTQLCEEKGITLKELSRRSGVSMSSLRKYQKNPKTSMRIQTIKKICDVFELSISAFLNTPDIRNLKFR